MRLSEGRSPSLRRAPCGCRLPRGRECRSPPTGTGSSGMRACVRVARARASRRAWGSGAWVNGRLAIYLDATLITAHSDKQGAEGTYKHGYGFHPLGAWLDRGDGTGESLAVIMRPGSAGANTAADHNDVLN